MMKKKSNFMWLAGIAIAFALSSCSSGGAGGEEPELPKPEPPVAEKIPINLSCGIKATSRVTDTGYENGDKVGLYVVNYNGSTPGSLGTNGNHVNNVAFTYNGKWSSSTTLYWKDNTTPADFYCYYPYGTPTDVAAYIFGVKADQSTSASYKASEFLWGKATKVTPTENAVNIMTSHLFSQAAIEVAAGDGFTEEGLKAANISIKLNGCKNNASINLRDGKVTATGDAASITPWKDGDSYRALVVPQTVKADNFISVTVDGREYKLNKEFTFVGGKRHQFTVTVNKTSNGINVGINDWEDDGKDNGGTAE